MNNYEFNPMRDFETIAREIGKVFTESQKSAPMHENEPKHDFKPRTDILEDNEKIYFQIELPGIKKEEVKLTVSPDNVLTVSGTKVRNIADGVNLCCRQERRFGEFLRSFKLPDYIDSDKISAKFESGVLTIAIERKVEVKPKENFIKID